MTILVDIDSTITNFGEALLKTNNVIFGTDYTYDQIATYDWFNFTFADPWAITKHPGFWDVVKVNPDAVSTLESWVKQGHKVYLVTASHFNDTLGYKILKTLEAFNPELINERNVVIAQDKSIVMGNVMIDDCVDNLENFDGVRICYAQPWNENFKEVFRYNNWDKIDSVIQGFSRFSCYKQ